MKALVWHWGRRGAGPLFASCLAEAINGLQGQSAALSLAAGAELLEPPGAPRCDWREPTYRTPWGYAGQRLAEPFLKRRSDRNLRRLAPDFAICAMPALLDRRMVAALRRRGLPYGVVVHDARAHLGEALRFEFLDQSRLLRDAAALFPLTAHVEADLLAQNYGRGGQRIVKLWHPPFNFGEAPAPLAHGGAPRILCFGRLLPYKGLDLLADALTLLGPDRKFELRICGQGPKSAELHRLASMPGVVVENRWIPELELPGLLAWADGVVLPYREASQSGVAAAAIAQGRFVLATHVGGLPEQLAGLPRTRLCPPDAGAIAQGLANLFTDADVALPPVDAAADWRDMAAALMTALAPAAEPVPLPALGSWRRGFGRQRIGAEQSRG